MVVLAHTKTYENCPNGHKGISYLHDDQEHKTGIECQCVWNRVTNEIVKNLQNVEYKKGTIKAPLSKSPGLKPRRYVVIFCNILKKLQKELSLDQYDLRNRLLIELVKYSNSKLKKGTTKVPFKKMNAPQDISLILNVIY